MIAPSLLHPSLGIPVYVLMINLLLGIKLYHNASKIKLIIKEMVLGEASDEEIVDNSVDFDPLSATVSPLATYSLDQAWNIVRSPDFCGPYGKITVTDLFYHYNLGDMELPHRRIGDYALRITDETALDLLPKCSLPKLSSTKQRELDSHIQEYLNLGLIREVKFPRNYSIPSVTGKAGERRLVVDYRGLNGCTQKYVTKSETFYESVVDVEGNLFSTINLFKAYQHLRLDPSTEELTTFKTSRGYFCFRVLPLGLENSAAIFSTFLRKVLRPHANYCRFYSGEILIFSNSPQEHMQHLGGIFQTLTLEGLHLNKQKSNFFKTSVVWLGHRIQANHLNNTIIYPGNDALLKIANFPVPQNRTEIRRFLGCLSFLSPHIPNLSAITVPLSDLIRSDREFRWTSEAQAAFTYLKNLELNLLALTPYRSKSPLKIVTHGFDLAMGAVLLQWKLVLERYQWVPVKYISRKFLFFQVKWGVVDKELYAIWLAVEKFQRYIACNNNKTIVETNHEGTFDAFKIKPSSEKQRIRVKKIMRYNITVTNERPVSPSHITSGP